MFTSRCKMVHDLGAGPYNMARWNPQVVLYPPPPGRSHTQDFLQASDWSSAFTAIVCKAQAVLVEAKPRAAINVRTQGHDQGDEKPTKGWV